MKHLAWSLVGTLMALQSTSTPRPAAPLEPVSTILEAFRTHHLVAVTAGHGEERGYAFGLALVRDPRVVAVINDVVIEEGSARYQDVADRFVNGEEVPEDALRHIWRDTTQPGLGQDRPWTTFFAAVRSVNASLDRAKRLRVLLGDPPIEWETVKTSADHRKWIEMRDIFPADLIQREVLAKGRRALITYGQMHFQRKNLVANYESDGLAQTIVSRLERQTGQRVFTIWTSIDVPKLQPDAASWPTPSIALVRGTTLGAADFTAYYKEELPRIAIRGGKPDFSSPIPRDQWRTLRAEDQFDAVLYPGHEPSALVPQDRARCADRQDINEHLRRMSLAGPPNAAEQLKAFCGDAGGAPAAGSGQVR